MLVKEDFTQIGNIVREVMRAEVREDVRAEVRTVLRTEVREMIRTEIRDILNEILPDMIRKIVKEEIAIALKPVYRRLDKIERNMKIYTRFFDSEIIEIRKKLD